MTSRATEHPLVPPTPPAPATPTPQPAYPRRWAALVVLCLALAVITMDNLIANTALPSLARELNADTAQLQWIVDAYILVFAGAVLSMGSLGDRFGRRRALNAGLIVFMVGSLASAFAGTADLLVAARALMGLGAAVTCPSTLSIITNMFPPAERGKAIGIWASFSVLGVVGGPTAGGLLLEHYWWGSVFLINVPLVAALLIAIRAMVPESRDPEATPLDPAGALLSVTGLTALVYAIIEVPVRGWVDPLTLAGFTTAAILLTGFIAWERHTAHPMLPLYLFSDRRFTAANATLTLMFFAMNGIVFVLTQYLQGVLDYTPLHAGVAILPVTAMVLTAPTSAVLVRLTGTKPVVATGLLVQAAGVLTLAGTTPQTGYPRVGLALVLFGLGMGLAVAPATESVMQTLPPAKAGVGSALNDTTRSVGGALGVAVIGSVLAAGYHAGLNPTLAGLPAPIRDAVRNSVEAAARAAAAPGAGGGDVVRVARAAYLDGMHTALLIAALTLIAAAALAAVLVPMRSHHDHAPADEVSPEV